MAKKILIIEDEQPMARALMFKLKSEGFEVDTAFDGQSGIKKIQEAKAGYDVVILDLMMPLLDGFGVLKKLEELKDKTPVMVASNLSHEQDVQKAKALGAVDFLVKSDVSLSEVVTKVKKYLKK
jgi:DNA-binding response OmpR family regulator